MHIKNPLTDEAAMISELHGSYIFCAAWFKKKFQLATFLVFKILVDNSVIQDEISKYSYFFYPQTIWNKTIFYSLVFFYLLGEMMIRY